MMATGEVMAIANSFEHAFMKAVQSIELGLETPTLETLSALTDEEVVEKLHVRFRPLFCCVRGHQARRVV